MANSGDKLANLAKIVMSIGIAAVHCVPAIAQQKVTTSPATVAKSRATTFAVDKLLLFPPDCYQLTRERKYNEALAKASKLIASKKGDSNLATLRVYLLVTLRRPSEAVKFASELIPMKRRLADLRMLRGIAYLDLRQYDKAISDLSESISLCPERASSHQLRGQAYAAIGRNDLALIDNQAFRCFKELHAAWEAFVPGEVLKPLGHINPNADYSTEFAAGQKAFNRRDYPTAISYFTHVIALKPNLKAAYFYRAVAYEPLESREKAAADLTKVIGSGSGSFDLPICVGDDAKKRIISQWYRVPYKMGEPYLRRSRCYLGLQKNDLALSDANEAVKLQPEDRYAVECRGNVLTAMERFADAIKDFELAERLDPEYAGGGYKMVRCFRELNDQKKVIQRLSWLMRTSPKDDVLYLERADALSKLGFHNEAIRDLNKVVELAPEIRDGYIRRAQELEIIGEYHMAVNDLTKAIELDSSKAKPAWIKRQALLEKLKNKKTETKSTTKPAPAKHQLLK